MIEGKIEQSGSFENLRGKKVLMVDDSRYAIVGFSPYYKALIPDSDFDSILQTNQNVDALVVEIISKEPEIVLMDYNLASGINGGDVVKALKAQKPDIKVFGFSAEEENEQAFASAGADGMIVKKPGESKQAIEKLNQLLA